MHGEVLVQKYQYISSERSSSIPAKYATYDDIVRGAIERQVWFWYRLRHPGTGSGVRSKSLSSVRQDF